MEELESVQLSDDELNNLRRDATHRADYSILSRHVRLSGNEPVIIERFEALYAPFRRDVPAGDSPDIHIWYRVGPDGTFTVKSEGDMYRVVYPEIVRWPSIVFNRIMLGRIRTHYLIHAGCVARNGQAIVIAGASGMGKTTLVAHLAARGFEFLSDEFAPISRSDGWIEPYPMRLGLRHGPGRDLLGDKFAIDLSFRGDDKKLADIETLAGQKPAQRAPLRAVILLTTDLTVNVTTAQKRGDHLKAWFTSWTDAMGADLEKTLGAHVLGQRPDDDMIEVTLRLRDLMPNVEAMRDLARRHGGLLAQIQFEDMGEKDRSATPQLMPIPAAAGVIELIKKLQSYTRNALIEHEFGGKASAMVMDLSALVKDASFYKLTPGRLEDTIALVEKLAS